MLIVKGLDGCRAGTWCQERHEGLKPSRTSVSILKVPLPCPVSQTKLGEILFDL